MPFQGALLRFYLPRALPWAVRLLPLRGVPQTLVIHRILSSETLSYKPESAELQAQECRATCPRALSSKPIPLMAYGPVGPSGTSGNACIDTESGRSREGFGQNCPPCLPGRETLRTTRSGQRQFLRSFICLASMLRVAWGTARKRSFGMSLPVTRQMP